MFDAIRKLFANRHKLPGAQRAEFEQEGLLALDEYVKARLTYLNFKAPGKRFAYKTVWFRSHVAVTKMRVFAMSYGKLAINVPFSDEQVNKMHFSVEDGRLLVAFDAGLFQPTWSGQLEYRFTTAQAEKFVSAINAQTSGPVSTATR